MSVEKNAEKKEGKEESKKEKRKLLGLEPISTQHELALKDRTLNYSARAGVLAIKDDQDEIEAEIFFMAYELEGEEDRSDRPLTFAFNGGPGSSSI